MEIFSNGFFEQKLDYIHANPIRAGLVENPEEYIYPVGYVSYGVYSSAKNYAGENRCVQVETIDRVWKTVR